MDPETIITESDAAAEALIAEMDSSIVKAANYGARAGQTIAGRLIRGSGGRFASSGTPVRDSATLTAEARRQARATLAQAKVTRGKGKGKGRAPAKTAEQKLAEKEAQRAANREKTFGALELPSGAAANLQKLAAGDDVPDDGALTKLGLAVKDKEGKLRLTPPGRAVMAAAQRGDVGRARDALSLGKDRAAALAEKQGKGGGGGGGSKPSKEEQQATNRQSIVAAMTEANAGLNSQALDALFAFADGGTAEDAMLEAIANETGLVSIDTNGGFRLSTQGRRFVRSANRGDVRGALDALSEAFDRVMTLSSKDDDGQYKAWMVDYPFENEMKHGHHDQSSHGRRGARGGAYRAAYQSARSGGGSIADARAAGRDASTAIYNRQRMANIQQQLSGTVSDRHRRSLEAEHTRLKADTDKRMARLSPEARSHVENAAIKPTVRGRQDDGLFGREYQERQRMLQEKAKQREQAQQDKPRQASDVERAGFINQQLRQSTPAESKPVIKPGASAPPTTPLGNMAAAKPERYAHYEDATQRVKMPQPGWNAPVTERQQGYLNSLADKAIRGTPEGSPQRELANAIADASRSGKLTKWEASQFIDAMQKPKPMSTLLIQSRAGIRSKAEQSGEESWRALYALPSIRASLINYALRVDAEAEELPF